MLSDFASIRRFSRLFIDWASSKWALSCAALPNFPLFLFRPNWQSLSQPGNRLSEESWLLERGEMVVVL